MRGQTVPLQKVGEMLGAVQVCERFFLCSAPFCFLPFSLEARAPSCDGDVEHCALTAEFRAHGLSKGAPAGGGQEMEVHPQP